MKPKPSNLIPTRVGIARSHGPSRLTSTRIGRGTATAVIALTSTTTREVSIVGGRATIANRAIEL